MKFHPVEPTEDFSVLRFLSDSGRWQFGMTQMLFGVRVCLSQTKDGWYTLDYCAGDDQAFTILLFAVVAQILESFPEEASPKEIQQAFPRYIVKPIIKDWSWVKLQEMAGLTPPPYWLCPQCFGVSYEPQVIQEENCDRCNYQKKPPV